MLKPNPQCDANWRYGPLGSDHITKMEPSPMVSVLLWKRLSTGFPRREYWSRKPLSSLGDVPIPGIKPGSLAWQTNSLPSEPPGNYSSLNSWTVKKAEHWGIDAFELWCWRRLLRDPWTARRSNQSTLKEISPGISLEGMMLKLKLQYFCHLMQRVDWLEKTLMLGVIGGRRRRVRLRMRWLGGITNSMTWDWVNSRRWWWAGRPCVLKFMGSQRVGHDWATELNWKKGIILTKQKEIYIFISMWNTSWETLVWRKHKLESRLLGEKPVTSDKQVTPPLWKKVKNN